MPDKERKFRDTPVPPLNVDGLSREETLKAIEHFGEEAEARLNWWTKRFTELRTPEEYAQHLKECEEMGKSFDMANML